VGGEGGGEGGGGGGGAKLVMPPLRHSLYQNISAL